MNPVFGAHIFRARDVESNVQQMNSLLLNMISQSSFCDCQSMPLKEYFSDFYVKARFSVEDTFDRYLSAAPVSLRPTKAFERWLERTPYTDITQYRAEIPEGMIVSYAEYLAVIKPAQERANRILTDVVEPFSKFVGKMISDPIFRNQPGHQLKEHRKLEPEYVSTIKAFSKLYGQNDFRASAPFSEVVKRNGDWQFVFNETAALKKLYQAFPAADLTKKLNDLYSMLDELIDQVKLDKFDRVEKEVTQLLSVGMYHIAKEIELASLTTFRSKTFIAAIDTTIKNVEEIAKL